MIMVRWKCENCGKVHKSNPKTCTNCNYTVFKQYREKTNVKASKNDTSSLAVILIYLLISLFFMVILYIVGNLSTLYL